MLWGNSGGTILLTASNATGCDTLIQLSVTNVGMTKPNITGTSSVCNASLFNQQYSISNNIGSTYNWSITNGSIISGQSTNDIQVKWTGSGRLIVTENGSLGCQLKDTFDFVYSPLLATNVSPSVISGCSPLNVNFTSTTLNPEPLNYQ